MSDIRRSHHKKKVSFDTTEGHLSEDPAKISEDLSQLLASSFLSDITLFVEGRELHAHRIILAARSPVFKAMFGHHMLENIENLVEIKEISLDVMIETLRFIYTGKAPNLHQMADNLLAAADRYALANLKTLCAEFIWSTVTTDNVCGILKIADLHSVPNLKANAMDFIISHSNEVFTTGSYKTMDQPHLLREILQSIKNRQPLDPPKKKKKKIRQFFQ